MYSDSERRIFRHKVGDKFVAVDPASVDRKFLKYMLIKGHDVAETFSQSSRDEEVELRFAEEDRRLGRKPDDELSAEETKQRNFARQEATLISLEAGERLAAATRHAFDLPPFDSDGGGFTEGEVLGVLNAYMEWKDAVKKNTGSSPDGSPSTDGPPAASDDGGAARN